MNINGYNMELAEKSWFNQDITLWSALILTILLMISIQFVANSYKLTLLDTIANPTKAREQLDHMCARQKKAHVWITATLDVAFPLTYGFLFAAAALRFFPQYGGYLVLPALLVILVDLIEGVIQILALTESNSLKLNYLLKLKRYITSLKFVLFILALFIALGGLAKEGFRNIRI